MAVSKTIAVVSYNQGAVFRRLRSLLLAEDYKVIGLSHTTCLTERLLKLQSELVIFIASIDSFRFHIESIVNIRKINQSLPLILITSQSSEKLAIEAFRAGVNDYFCTSANDDELLNSVRDRILSYKSNLDNSTSCEYSGPLEVDRHLVGKSKVMLTLKRYLYDVARSDSNVLISGETGTGKDVVARMIHQLGKRTERQMVCLNCAAVPESILESELFGYNKGAFTGATCGYEGKLKLAEGGSVFFDEIGDMSLQAQTKILRAIENKEFYRLGGKKEIALDFRIIAATNQELESKIIEGSFRRDLYYRLNVVRIHLPALRERKEDIPYLIEHFIKALNIRFSSKVNGIQEQALDIMLAYDWPGNVRELKNVLEAAFINRPSLTIGLDDLPKSFQENVRENEDKGDSLERDVILTALLATNWNKSQAAKKLKWSRMTLYRKIQKYHLSSS